MHIYGYPRDMPLHAMSEVEGSTFTDACEGQQSKVRVIAGRSP
jgi:hypothetical protein